MTRKTVVWLMVVAAIALMLGGAAVILKRNAGSHSEIPTGFLH